ncbi:carbohydrate esterase family 4 protein [Macrolepiota fuliginosa MF-IS2]|uniref:Carbohydrate esterase family 4 protein n=1 Tax=Macrolepiota fuliginosa MF-IS2 TaxID=1400762 RepID=A0A9P5X6Z3_9AGAR|nr:carbohydrate esterase family 4 protein [Macrolepiota fuliginosa MF-IS2]
MNFKSFVSIVALGVLANAAPHKRQSPAVITTCTTPNTVALTFDDGPYNFSAEIIQTLNAAGAKGTFFYNGNNYGCIYDEANVERIQNAFASGHQVASHTWSHPHLPQLSLDQVQFEMTSTHEALIKITGAAPAFMRPHLTPDRIAYGEYNDNVLSVAASLKETVVTWDFDSEDSLGAAPDVQESRYGQLIGQKPGTILSLEHEPLQTTAEQVLPFLISKLQAAGYQLVTVAECLGAQPYLSTGTPGVRDATWTCGA